MIRKPYHRRIAWLALLFAFVAPVATPVAYGQSFAEATPLERVHKAANVAALSVAANFPRVKDGDICELAGYTTEGDGGGQPLYYDLGSSATVDNGFVFTAPGGRWIAVDQTYINAKRWGATDDGADDRARLQAAIDKAEAVGGTVIVPVGTYLVSSPGLTITQSMTLEGVDWDNSTLKASAAGYAVITATWNAAQTERGEANIKNLHILASDTPDTNSVGIQLGNGTDAAGNVFIEHCKIDGITGSKLGTGIKASFALTNGIRDTYCRFWNRGIWLDSADQGHSSNATPITDCIIRENNFGISGVATSVQVKGGTIEGNVAAGIDFNGGFQGQLTVEGAHFENTGGAVNVLLSSNCCFTSIGNAYSAATVDIHVESAASSSRVVSIGDVLSGGINNENNAICIVIAQANPGAGTFTGNVNQFKGGTTNGLEVTPGAEGQAALRVNHSDGARRATIGTFPGSPTLPAFWLTSAAPSSSNYALAADAQDLYVNAPVSVMRLGTAGTAHWTIDTTGALTATATGQISYGASTELTIATGAIAATRGYHSIDTEADAASDDLDTITGGSTGMVLVVRAENDARTVVLKDGTGNIQGPGDITLDNTQDTATLLYNGSAWLVTSTSNNGT